MFRVLLPPIIRKANNCIYSIWYLSHRYCYLPLSWKSWNRFECAVGGATPPKAQSDLLETSGPAQACNGNALPLYVIPKITYSVDISFLKQYCSMASMLLVRWCWLNALCIAFSSTLVKTVNNENYNFARGFVWV